MNFRFSDIPLAGDALGRCPQTEGGLAALAEFLLVCSL